MKRKFGNSLKLFLTMFQIGCIGFGGGNALIPVLHRKTVEEQNLLSDEEFEEDVMIASITPGALPVEIAGGIGHRIAGWKGTLLGSYGMAAPGVILTLFLLVIFEKLSTSISLQIQYITLGVSAFICVLLSDYVRGTLKNESDVGRKKIDIAVIAVVFILTCGKNFYRILGISKTPLFGLATIDIFILAFFLIFLSDISKKNKVVYFLSVLISCVYILLHGKGIPIKSDILNNITIISMVVLSCAGIVKSLRTEHKVIKNKKEKRVFDILALLIIMAIIFIPSVIVLPNSIEFTEKGLLSSLISFGGGDAYLTVADGMFVESGLISENSFYGNLVPIVNVLPGSILCKSLSGVGFYVGKTATGSTTVGLLLAVLGFTISVFASVGIFSLIHQGYGVLSQCSIFVNTKKWIRPIVSGLMFTVILSLVYQSRKINTEIFGWYYVVLMIVLFSLGMILHRKNTGDIKIIILLIVLSVLMSNIVKY